MEFTGGEWREDGPEFGAARGLVGRWRGKNDCPYSPCRMAYPLPVDRPLRSCASPVGAELKMSDS